MDASWSRTLLFDPSASGALPLDALAQGAMKGPVAGLDEAGRGPWAGPVVAAAVIFDPKTMPDGLADSKALTPARREALYDLLTEHARVGVGIVDVETIDRINILAASLQAMAIAFAQLGETPTLALVDGNRAPDLPCPTRCLVKGDALSPVIAAASIIAKVTRDRIMVDLDAHHPGYGWASNKGYGTKDHAAGLDRFGATRHHRRSFRPVAQAIAAHTAP